MNGSFGTQDLIRAYETEHGVLGRNILSWSLSIQKFHKNLTLSGIIVIISKNNKIKILTIKRKENIE